MAKRLQIQIDVSEEYRRQIKAIAALEGVDMRRLILTTLAEKYPQLTETTNRLLKSEREEVLNGQA